MTLITILLALWIDSYRRSFQSLRRLDFVTSFVGGLQAHWGEKDWFNSRWGVLFTVAALSSVIALIQYWLGNQTGVLSWLVTMVFSVVVLILCIGPDDINAHVKEYLSAWKRDDQEAAYLYVKKILDSETEPPQDAKELNQKVIASLLVRVNVGMLAVFFWFVVLGPVGAVMYRITAHLKSLAGNENAPAEGFQEAALRLHAILDWLPARLTAFAYAFVGDFVDAMQSWNAHSAEWVDNWPASNSGVLVASGKGAMGYRESADEEEIDPDEARQQIEDTLALVKRGTIVWLTVLAILTLVGWLA